MSNAETLRRFVKRLDCPDSLFLVDINLRYLSYRERPPEPLGLAISNSPELLRIAVAVPVEPAKAVD